MNNRLLVFFIISILFYGAIFSMIGLGVSRFTFSGPRQGLGRTFFLTAITTALLILTLNYFIIEYKVQYVKI